MPYLQFELDAKKKMAWVAQLAGVSRADAAWLLMEVWEYAWMAGADTLSELVLSGLIGPSEALRKAYVAYGFLEPLEGGAWRVKGTDRYTRANEARARGGKAASKNLIPGGPKHAKSSADLGSTSAGPRLQPSASPAETSADPRVIREPRAENRITTTPPTPSQQTPHPLPLVERVAEVFQAERGAEYAVTFSDEKAGRALLAKGSEDEVLRRWGIGLRTRYPACNSLSDLLRNWNAYAMEPAQEGARRPAAGIVRVLDRDRCSDDGCEAPAEREPYGQPLCEQHAREAEAFYRGQAAP